MAVDPDQQRAATREAWEAAAAAWDRHSDRIREWGMPVSAAMIEALDLQPGQRVLELAAGPGDTGFMAAEMVHPGGTLICTDGAEHMVEVARRRATALGVANVEFQQMELEWIDLETASVDAVLCRWGLMFAVDREAAAREIRRVLRSDGRIAAAVWDLADGNPWATLGTGALIELGHAEPPDPDVPGMFSLAPAPRLAELLEGAGFTEVEVTPVTLRRTFAGPEGYVAEQTEMSPTFGAVFRRLDEDARAQAAARIAERARPYLSPDGTLTLPGQSLVARATA